MVTTERGTVEYTTSRWSGAVSTHDDVALTALDLKALRQADVVSFHHYDGRAYIRATKRIEGEPFETERDYEVPVKCSDITDYSAHTTNADDSGNRNWTCFAMLHSAKYSAEWFTIVDTLRVGDILSFSWLRSNNNDILRDANLHHDQLRIQAERQLNKGVKRYSWNITDTIGFDNSARMVRKR